MNRVSASVARMRQQIAERIKSGLITKDRVEQARKGLDMEEFALFQNLKSIASMDGGLTLEEAQYVYGLLGETPAHFNGQDAAVKSLLNQLFRELLERSLGRA